MYMSHSLHPTRPLRATFEQFELYEAARAAFEEFDTNKSGKLEYHDLRRCLAAIGIDTSSRGAAAVLARYDQDGNGLLELDEFAYLVQQLGSLHPPRSKNS